MALSSEKAARPLLRLLPFPIEMTTNKWETGYTLKTLLSKDSVKFSKWRGGGTMCMIRFKKWKLLIFKDFSFQLKRSTCTQTTVISVKVLHQVIYKVINENILMYMRKTHSTLTFPKLLYYWNITSSYHSCGWSYFLTIFNIRKIIPHLCLFY